MALQYGRRCLTARGIGLRLSPLFLALAILPLSSALAVSPPSPGTILQQTLPPPSRPEAPGSVLTLPSPTIQRSQSKIKIPVKRIEIEGNTLISPSKLETLAHSLEGRTVTLGALDALATRITGLYQSRGYPLAYAYVPAQVIHHGVVNIAVIEPRYDRIHITGATRLKTSVVKQTLGVSVGEPISENPLSRGLLLLDRTPGIRVAGTLVPGAQPATSTLKVHLMDRPRVSVILGADNYGGYDTGRGRGTLGLSVADPFGYGSQFSANGLDSESGLLKAGGFNVLSPNLYDGLRLSLYGSRTGYRLGNVYEALDQTGRADQVGLGMAYPLILLPGRLLQLRLDVLHDGLTETTGSVGTQSRSSIDLERLTLSGAYADTGGGLTTVGVSLSHGHLKLLTAAMRAADAIGAQTAGNFYMAQLQVNRTQQLPARFNLSIGLSGQMASKNLDGSQQFYLGGPNGVMSYPVGDAGGDDGVLLRAELSHALRLSLPGHLRAALLAQAGQVWINVNGYPGAGAKNTASRAGAGIGLDYRLRHFLSASLSYVHAVGAAQATAAPDHRGELWASLNIVL